MLVVRGRLRRLRLALLRALAARRHLGVPRLPSGWQTNGPLARLPGATQRVQRPPGPQATGNRHRFTGTAPEQRLITASARQPAGAAADPLLLARPKTIHKRLFRDSLSRPPRGSSAGVAFLWQWYHPQGYHTRYQLPWYRKAAIIAAVGGARHAITNTSYYG